MLCRRRDRVRRASGWWWWWAPPGICIAAARTGLALLNFGIDEFINPRLRDGRALPARPRAQAGRPGPAERLRRHPRAIAESRPRALALGRRAAVPSPPAARAGADPVLEIRGLCVDYGFGSDAVHAVMDCDLVAAPGELLGLAGESGSGKSTLAHGRLRLLRSPARDHQGRGAPSRQAGRRGRPPRDVRHPGRGRRDLRAVRWSEISVVLQSALNALNPVTTIGAQFDDLLRAHRQGLSSRQGGTGPRSCWRWWAWPPDRLRSFPHELSGGMRQRAMIAMALALEPQVLILDEPTTALDVVTQREILEELMALRDRLGFAALFISHDLSLLAELADEIAVMYAGRIVE